MSIYSDSQYVCYIIILTLPLRMNVVELNKWKLGKSESKSQMGVCIVVERFSQYVRNIQIRRNVQRKYKTFVNCIVNPMIMDFNMFWVLVNWVIKIDQSDGALVVDMKVNRVGVIDEMEFAE